MKNLQNTLWTLFLPFLLIACDNNNTVDFEMESSPITKEEKSTSPYLYGKARIHVFYQWAEDCRLQDELETECRFTLSILDVIKDPQYIIDGDERYYNGRFADFCILDWHINENYKRYYNWITYDFKNLELPRYESFGYKLSLVTDILIHDKGFDAEEKEIDWYSAYYREKFDDGSYSEWDSAEVGSHVIWVDSTCEFYSNLEIACFNSKEMEDTYAPQLGITVY
jgi:transcriptional antiterminator Rof (Rho-off)